MKRIQMDLDLKPVVFVIDPGEPVLHEEDGGVPGQGAEYKQDTGDNPGWNTDFSDLEQDTGDNPGWKYRF